MHDPRYRQLFSREAARRLDELEDCVAAAGTPDFAGLMRGLHTLKGMAATMGAAPMVLVAHAAEDLCARGQSDPQAWGDDGQTLLLEGLDRLRAQAIAVAEGAEPPDGQRFDERVRALLRTGATLAFRLVQDLEAEPLPTALGESVRALSGVQAAIADAFSSARRLRQLCPGPPAEEVARLESSLRRVYDELVPMREVAFGSVVPALRRQVRGVADRTGKLAQLIVEGEEVRVDGSLLSRLMGPLSTLISNAVVHGVEAEATRQAAGKRRAGRVTVSAERVGRTLIVVVADDGAGFRRSPEEAAASGEAANADVDSGRGVGFEVVRQSVLELSGSLSVDSAPGVGTTVRLQLPVLADLVELAIVEVGPYRLALRRSVLDARAPAPASPSEDLLGLPNSRAVRLRLTDGRTVALDRVIDEGEYLVSPAPFPLNRMPWIRGTGVAPEGHIFFLVEP